MFNTEATIISSNSIVHINNNVTSLYIPFLFYLIFILIFDPRLVESTDVEHTDLKG